MRKLKLAQKKKKIKNDDKVYDELHSDDFADNKIIQDIYKEYEDDE